METKFVISIVTSIIALIGAIIASLFSYYSSKKSTKVHAMQAYLGFLQNKMNKLEEAARAYNKRVENLEEINSVTILNAVKKKCDIFIDIIFEYSYLLSKNDEYDNLKELGERITVSYANLVLASQNSSFKCTDKHEPISPNQLYTEMENYLEKAKNLISEESKNALKEFEDLSKMKN